MQLEQNSGIHTGKKKISGQRKRNTGKGKEAIEKEKTNDTEEERRNIVLKER